MFLLWKHFRAIPFFFASASGFQNITFRRRRRGRWVEAEKWGKSRKREMTGVCFYCDSPIDEKGSFQKEELFCFSDVMRWVQSEMNGKPLYLCARAKKIYLSEKSFDSFQRLDTSSFKFYSSKKIYTSFQEWKALFLVYIPGSYSYLLTKLVLCLLTFWAFNVLEGFH